MPRRQITLEAINERLKSAQIGLSVIQRGNRLSLRGTLPPRPGSSKTMPHQQTISLKVYANPAGLAHAEAKAFELGSLLAQKRFSWLSIQGKDKSHDSCEAWIEEFRKHAMQNLIKESGEQGEITWKQRYWYPAFSKLDPNADFCASSIVKALQKTAPNSSSRKICCQQLSRLAKFANLDIDISSYKGSYKTSEVKREIPPDDEIVAAVDAMKNSSWKWIAAMMATYGLRDHECWYATLVPIESEGRTIWMCNVSDGKTGPRTSIPPMPPEWCDRWALWSGKPPKINVKSNKEYGDRTSSAFNRQKNPHKPYSYRHAWAIRGSLKYKVPTAVMAQWMGHDPTMFLSTYQKHITSAQATEMYLDLI